MKNKINAENIIKYGHSYTIVNKLYNLTISIIDVKREVRYKTDGKLFSVFNLDGIFTKIKLTIKNNNSKNAEINSLILPIYLMDSSKNKIGRCEYGTLIRDYNLEDEKLKDVIPANSEISGYVYCKTESKDSSILSVSIPSNVTVNESGGYTITGDDYYFELNK